MKKFSKITFNAALAAGMLVAPMAAPLSAYAAAGDVPSDAKTTAVTVNNIEGAAEVSAYRIVKPIYNDEGFVRFEKAAGVSITDIEKPTADEATAIAQAVLNGTVSPDKTIPMKSNGATYTANLPAGEYIVLVRNATNAKFIYNPMIVSTYFTDANEADSLTAATPLDASGKYGVVFAKKTTITLDKEITDADGVTIVDDDSTDGSQADDLGVGDTAKFTIRTKIPAYSESYRAKGVTFKVEDTQDKGFDAPQNIVVTVGGAVVTEGANTFAKAITGNDYTLDFASDFILDHSGQNVVITYNSKLNAGAVQKFDANINHVKLTFTNDAYSKGNVATLDDDVQEYTFPVQVKKVNEENKPLEGAEFTLTRTDGNGKTGTNVYTIATNRDGIAQFDRLDEGTYTVKETKAPAGYAINPDIFRIKITPQYNADGSLNNYKTEMVNTSHGNQTVGNVTIDNPDGDILAGNITDSKLQTLPSTGGQGTTIAIIAAAGLGGVTLALVAYGKKKEGQKK